MWCLCRVENNTEIVFNNQRRINIVFSGDGSTIAVAHIYNETSRIVVLKIIKKSITRSPPEEYDDLRGHTFAINNNGSVLASGTPSSQTVYVMSINSTSGLLETEQTLKIPIPPKIFAWGVYVGLSSDGQTLILGDRDTNTIHIYTKKQPLNEYVKLLSREYSDEVTSVSVSLNGLLFAISSDTNVSIIQRKHRLVRKKARKRLVYYTVYLQLDLTN